MNRTRIKCCGITRVEDAVLAAGFGVDAVGLVFAARSKRRVDIARACTIRAALPPLMSAVALFMDNDADEVRAVIDAVQPDVLQFHGAEGDNWCAQFGRRYVKAIAMGEGAAALPRLRTYPGARALLLDGNVSGQSGGQGQVFDWSLVPRDLPQPLILAGGLDASNVGEAIRIVRPSAVDVSSGIESAPGIKDAGKMRSFVLAVHHADAEP
jgi:phosphoribosylanthranilate isomerase